MKNVILAIMGILLTLYTITICFSVFSMQTRKNQLNLHVSRILDATLEKEYQNTNDEQVQQDLINEITDVLGAHAKVVVEVKELDLQKGIISVKVDETFRQFNGKNKTLSCEKTVIMERRIVEEPKAVVKFLVEGETYKEYQLVLGEVCPMPKLPAGYSGWIEADAAGGDLLTEIGIVWEDKVYVATKK